MLNSAIAFCQYLKPCRKKTALPPPQTNQATQDPISMLQAHVDAYLPVTKPKKAMLLSPTMRILISILCVCAGVFLHDYRLAHVFVKQMPHPDVVLTGPLSQVSLERLEFVGVMRGADRLWALIRQPNGQVFHVVQGTRIGSSAAKITAITEATLQLKEHNLQTGDLTPRTMVLHAMGLR